MLYQHHCDLEENEDDERDAYIESRGGIDKCMNCGKYKCKWVLL
jgi:hypothetical protein